MAPINPTHLQLLSVLGIVASITTMHPAGASILLAFLLGYVISDNLRVPPDAP